MKSIKVIVPRMLIKEHLPHPEYYGESIVLLLNGMVTDVYTNEKGYLYTQTNKKTLINYLKKNRIKDTSYTLSDHAIRLRSITQHDINLVLDWMNEFTLYSYNEMKYEKEDVRIFISHSISSRSHVFIAHIDNLPFGLVGYNVIDQEGLIDLKIYKKNLVANKDIDLTLKLLLSHIHDIHNISKFSSLILQNDLYTQQLLTRNDFIKDLHHSIELPISEHLNIEAHQYHHCGLILKEAEKQLLFEFLEMYPHKLYELSNKDQLIDLEYAIDYTLKAYIKQILKKQVQHLSELEDIHLDEDQMIKIEHNLIQKYDEMMILLDGVDLEVAVNYKNLMLNVLPIINKYKEACLNKVELTLICNSMS